MARGDDTPASDLDIVVDVRPEDAWRFVSARRELSELLWVIQSASIPDVPDRVARLIG